MTQPGRCLQALVLSAILLPIVGLLPAPARALEFREQTVKGEVILSVTGPFQIGDEDRFLRAVQRMKRIDEVWLSSDGGSLSAGLQIGRHLRRLGLATRVPKGAECASACAYAFLGGVFRSLDQGGRIGVHMSAINLDPKFSREITGMIQRYGTEATHEVIRLVEQQAARTATAQARYLIEMSVHLDLMEPITDTHASKIYWLKPQELQRYNVINQ